MQTKTFWLDSMTCTTSALVRSRPTLFIVAFVFLPHLRFHSDPKLNKKKERSKAERFVVANRFTQNKFLFKHLFDVSFVQDVNAKTLCSFIPYTDICCCYSVVSGVCLFLFFLFFLFIQVFITFHYAVTCKTFVVRSHFLRFVLPHLYFGSVCHAMVMA